MRKTVVVVEDNEELRDLISMTLDEHELHLYADINGIDPAAGIAPDVVLTDLKLSSTEDPALIVSFLRKNFPSARIALISGNSELPAIARSQGVDFFKKPFDSDEIIAYIAKA